MSLQRITEKIQVLVDKDEAAELDKAYAAGGTLRVAAQAQHLDPVDLPDERKPKGETILIIDDNAATRRLLTEALSETGYEVKAASSAARGMEHLKGARPDLLLLDLSLPDIDGMQLLRQLKKSSLAGMPIMICTAKKERAVLVDLICAGAADVIFKPFSAASLIKKVWGCLEAPGKTMADRLREEARKKQTVKTKP